MQRSNQVGSRAAESEHSGDESDESDSSDSTVESSDIDDQSEDDGVASPARSPAASANGGDEPPASVTKRAGKRGGRVRRKNATKNVPYTRNGDGGTSQLFNGERRSKLDAAFEAMGTVDELCSIVGSGYAELMSSGDQRDIAYGELPDRLLDVMSRLFDVGSHVARPARKRDGDDKQNDDGEPTKFTDDGIGGGFDSRHTDTLEEWIDDMTEEMPELTSFILPTGSKASAQLHVARTVCRRAERRTVPLVHGDGTCDPRALKYLNRLSDFFFVAARYANYCDGREEVQYRREARGAKQRKRVVVKLKD